ncbi:MAG: hypothetical protein ACRYGA_13050 [Janthinobacterium lividum]
MSAPTRFVLAAAMALVAVARLGLGEAVAAGITRCTDATGKVSYTDKACPSETRQSAQLEVIETNGTSIPGPGATSPPPASAAAVTATPGRTGTPARYGSLSDSGLVVIDPRARPPQQASTNLEPDRDDGDPYAYPYAGYPYAGYPGAYRRQLAPPQDLRPALRNCDAGGCSDTMGNHYDRAGKVDRFARPDGRTCRPVGTTVVC